MACSANRSAGSVAYTTPRNSGICARRAKRRHEGGVRRGGHAGRDAAAHAGEIWQGEHLLRARHKHGVDGRHVDAPPLHIRPAPRTV
jgi:hypothetical protein